MTTKKFQYPKKNRLCLREDFLYLQKDSLKFSSPTCFIYYRPSRIAVTETRVGFSISKKMGNAVTRNRLKRILRNTFRLSDRKLTGVDCLVVLNIKQRNFFTENPEQYEKLLIRDFLKGLQKLGELRKMQSKQRGGSPEQKNETHIRSLPDVGDVVIIDKNINKNKVINL